MNSESNELIAGLFSDSMNIEILCSIYENEVTAEAITNLLNFNEDEVTKKLEMLFNNSFVKRRQKGNSFIYSLVNPKVCDSILSLRDSIENSDRII